jgi:NDP-sugar pyrophosphorylase family protein
MRTVVVLAGGLGIRIRDVTRGELPKAMIPVNGEPFLHHKLAELVRLGANRAVLLVAHQSEQIVDYIEGDRGWDLDIEIVMDGPALLGTGGSIRAAVGSLPERFWVTYGDTLLNVDLDAAERLASRHGLSGVMTVLHNCDRWEPSNVRVTDGVVTAYSKQPTPAAAEHLDYGYIYLERSSVEHLGVVDDTSFELSDVLKPLVARRRLGAFEAHERFHDVGTPKSLLATERWLQTRR